MRKGSTGKHYLTDADFTRIFEDKHGAEEREYYMIRAAMGNTWSAIEDGFVERGRASHTPPSRGAE